LLQTKGRFRNRPPGLFIHGFGTGNHLSGQGQNDADLGNHRDFLRNYVAGIGNIYGGQGNYVAGQGQNDADQGNHRDFLRNYVASIGNIYDGQGNYVARQGQNPDGRIHKSVESLY